MTDILILTQILAQFFRRHPDIQEMCQRTDLFVADGANLLQLSMP
jgi:hypothetical protein